MSKCEDEATLVAGIEEALRHDRKVLVEEGMAGREIEVGVLGNDHPEASVPGEVLPGRDFSRLRGQIPGRHVPHRDPRPPSPPVVQLQELAVAAFRAVDASGMARVDFFYDEADRDGRALVVNEINTIPGFTVISMFPKLWEALRGPYPRLLDRLIELALERHRQRPRPEAVGASWLEDQAVRGGRSDR